MKPLSIALFALLLLPSAQAGLVYDFRSVSSGMSKQTLAGSVRAEGPNMRVDFTTGDGLLFRSGSYAIASGGRKILSVVDPSARTFYELDTDRILGGADAMLRQFGGKFEVSNPKVRVTNGGDAGTMAGLPAQKSRVESSFDMALQALGQNMKMQMHNTTDVWWTRSVGAEFTSFLQKSGLKTGIEAVDKLLAAQTPNVNGFPLKQVTTTKIVMNGNAMSTTTTSEVSNVRPMKIAPAAFAVPAGFVMVASPLEKMLTRGKL